MSPDNKPPSDGTVRKKPGKTRSRARPLSENSPTETTADQFAIVVEDIRRQMGIVVGAVRSLDEKVDRRFSEGEARFSGFEQAIERLSESVSASARDVEGLKGAAAAVETRLAAVEARFDRAEARHAAVEASLDRVETRLAAVEASLDLVEARFDEVETRLAGVEQRLARRADAEVVLGLSARVSRLEAASSGQAPSGAGLFADR